MSDNLAIEPSIFYKQAVETETDTPSEPEEVETETSIEEEPAEEVTETEEAEESVSEGEEAEVEPEAEQEESTEALYVEFDDEEVSFETLAEWKQAHKDIKSMQADYTRKTQGVSAKATELANEMVSKEIEALSDLTAQMTAALDVEDVDLEELREYDEGEYYKQLHKKEKRDKLISKAKEELSSLGKPSKEEVEAEQAKLVELNPGWADKEGKGTPLYKSDVEAINKYLTKNNANGELGDIYKASHLQAILKAARYDELQSKKKVITEKRKKSPIIRKGKPAAKKEPAKEESYADIFYSK
jgi:hypothetical protein